MNFFLDNWIVIVSLLIALTGGVPGILSVVKHYRNRPRFGFTLANVITGQRSSGTEGIAESIVMLSGTITNATDNPLTSDHYELKVKIDNARFISLTKWLIPEDLVLNSKTQDIDLQSPNDLQRWRKAITIDTSVDGQFIFIAKEIELRTLKDAKKFIFCLTCHDVFGKQHKTTFDYDASGTCSNVMFPGQGLTIRDKKKT